MVPQMNNRYTRFAITLHWLIALAILLQLVSGIWMVDAIKDKASQAMAYDTYQWHKSLGLMVLVLSLLRLGWRIFHTPPALPNTLKPYEKKLAHAAHAVLYLLMISIPLIGWMMVSSSPFGLPTMIFGLFEWPHLPLPVQLIDQETLFNASKLGHKWLAIAMMVVLAGHIIAALKHHFYLKDDVLRRMLPLVAILLWLTPFTSNASPWTINHDKSYIRFSGQHAGRDFEGHFNNWSGVITFDPQQLDKSNAVINIDMTSATTDDKTYTKTLAEPDWFGTGDHPSATFKTTHFTHLENEAYTIDGQLTIKSLVQPVTLSGTITTTSDTSIFEGTTTLQRLGFDIGKKSDASGDWVSLDIQVTVYVVATL